MKPKWTLISYQSKTSLLKEGKDNVFVLDAGNLKTNIVKIYVFSGAIGDEGMKTIRANVEGSHYRDEGYLFYPERRHPQIQDLITTIFPGAKLNLKEDEDSKKLAWNLFVDGMGSKVKTNLVEKDIVLNFYELEKEINPLDGIFSATNTANFLENYHNLPEDSQQAITIGVQQIASEILPHEDKIRRIFGRIQKITDEIAANAELLRVLESILDGIIQTFGTQQLAASICGFDESLPSFYQFDPTTYIVKGPDKVQRKNMVYPPRLGKHLHPVDGKIWLGTAMQVMEYQHHKLPSQRPVYVSNIARWPDWMPPLRDPKDPKVASTAYIPLIVSDQRVGIIIMQFSEHHAFQQDEKQEISLYAKIASSILYNAQLEKRLNRNLDGIKLLKEFVNKSINARDVEDVIGRAAKLTIDFGFDGFAMCTLPEVAGESSQTYYSARNIDLTVEIPQSLSFLEFPIKYWEKSLESMFDRQVNPTNWCLGYALESQGKKLGLLLILRSSGGNIEVSPFVDYERDWVQSLSQQLNIIIGELNGKERLANKSVSISNVAKFISENPDALPLELLGSISKELIAVFKEKDFYIAFYDPNIDEIRYQKLYRAGRFIDSESIAPWKKRERHGAIEHVIDTGQTLFLPESFEENIARFGLVMAHDQVLPKSYLGVPIKRKNKIYGVIAVQDFKEANSLRTSDKAVLEALASLIGLQMD